MKKNVLLFSFLSIILWSINAQSQVSIGVRGGLSIPNLSANGDNPMSQGYKSRLANGAALFAEFHFSDLFSLQPMIEYSGQGGKRDGIQAVPGEMLAPLMNNIPDQIKQNLPEYLYANFKSEAKFDYLMIPVLAKFGWNLGAFSPFRLYVDAGPFVSFLLNAKQTTTGTSPLYTDDSGTVTLNNLLSQFGVPAGTLPEALPLNDNRDIKPDLHSVNAGIEGNIGISYAIGKKHSIFIEGGGNYGFLKLQKDSKNGDNRIGAGTVMVGYACHL